MIPNTDLSEILRFPHRGLKKSVDDVRKVRDSIERLQRYPDDHIDLTSLIYTLPFDQSVNIVICKTLQDSGKVCWRPCLASLAWLVSGSIEAKLEFITTLFGLVNPSTSSWRTIVKESLKNAQKLSISLSLQLQAKRNKHKYPGLARYYGEDNLNTLVDEILSLVLRNHTIDLYKPLSFTWKSLTPASLHNSPTTRSNFAVCLSGHNIYLLGGRDGKFPVSDFWRYDLVTECWENINPKGDDLPYLEQHTMLSYGMSLYIFGGVLRMPDETEIPFWIYDTGTNELRQWHASGEVMLPPSLRGHSSVIYNKNMYIFGGCEDLAGSSDILWSYDLCDDQWHIVYQSNMGKTGPCARHSHSATLHNDTMYIIGGLNSLSLCTDMWAWSFTTYTWSQMKTSTAIPKVYGHTAAKLGNSIYVYGGQTNGGLSKNLWEYRISQRSWKAKDKLISGGPPRRCHHALVLVPPSAFTVPVTERSHSDPIMDNSYRYGRSRKISSTSDLRQHGDSTCPPSFLELNQSDENGNFRSSEKTSANGKPATSIPKKTSSLYRIPTSKSESKETLFKKLSSISSEDFLTFDNPAYESSQEKLVEVAISQSKLQLSSPEPYSHYHPAKPVYGIRSQSVDTLQDIMNDTAVLPGSVVSSMSNLLSDTCTVRNIVIDEWTNDSGSSPVNDNFEAYSFKRDGPKNAFHMFVFGGEELGGYYVEPRPLVTWRCEISNLRKSQKKN